MNHGQPTRRKRDGAALLPLAVLALVAGASAAWAQAPAAAPLPPMARPAPPPQFAIRGFKITGDNPLGEGETTRILAPFLRANASLETLQQATSALEAALRTQGFGLYRVALPPQEVGETVTIHIVRFTIGTVTLAGTSIYEPANIRRSLPELREGSTPNMGRLAVQAAIANENPNKQIQLGLRDSARPDAIDAIVTVKESRPWTFGVGISNAGSSSTGRDRLTVSGGHTNVFDLDHQFVGAYTTSLERSGDVRQLGLSYRIPLYSLGGIVGVSATRSDVVGNFGTFTSTGAGHTTGASYTHYLAPQGGRRSYVTLALDDKVFDATLINNIPVSADRRSRPVTLGYTARTESDTSVWGYGVELSANTGGGSGNDLASWRSEDPRVDTTRFKILRGSFSYTASLPGQWLAGARLQAQYSPDVLISGEQFGLGGVGSVRGTRIERPLAGDKGASGTLEVNTPELTAGLRLLGFMDAGWLGNNSPTSASKPASDRLASAGLGLRFTQGAFSVAADYGRIVRGSRVPTTLNSASPQEGDDRFYLNLSLRF
jgi:hemolysin activation/secretion protein